jgi:hypothetical protein
VASAGTVARSGIPYPLAIEIARQMTAGVGNAIRGPQDGDIAVEPVHRKPAEEALRPASYAIISSRAQPGVAERGATEVSIP